MENQIVKTETSKTVDKIVYTGKTHTTGGRDGGTISTDGQLDVKLSSPGTGQPGTNPEQLFAAGWSACFLSALRISAQKFKVPFPANAAVDAEVDLRLSGHSYSLGARLHVILPGIDKATAEAIAASAHQICPYSKATNGNIDVQTTVSTK